MHSPRPPGAKNIELIRYGSRVVITSCNPRGYKLGINFSIIGLVCRVLWRMDFVNDELGAKEIRPVEKICNYN